MLEVRISELLYTRRKELHLTLEELSKECGISLTSLTKYEKGRCLPTVGNLYKLSQALDLDYDKACDILLKEKESRQ